MWVSCRLYKPVCGIKIQQPKNSLLWDSGWKSQPHERAGVVWNVLERKPNRSSMITLFCLINSCVVINWDYSLFARGLKQPPPQLQTLNSCNCFQMKRSITLLRKRSSQIGLELVESKKVIQCTEKKKYTAFN